MTSDTAAIPRRRWRRHLIVAAIVCAALMLVSFVAALCLPGQEPMPAVVWVSRSTPASGVEVLRFRADTADGELIQGTQVASTWSGASASGVSVRRPLGDLAKAKIDLATVGFLPYARIEYAGFESTGRVEVRDGVKWQEFRKFQDDFGQTGFGWGAEDW